MTRRRLAVLTVALVTVVGCGAPRFDSTSEETTKTSMERMSRGLNEEQKQQLAVDIATVTMPNAMNAALAALSSKDDPKQPGATGVMKPLHGKTAAEIHALAENVRADMDAASRR